jgi:hypothetical protein
VTPCSVVVGYQLSWRPGPPITSPWTWKHHGHLKHWYPTTSLHCVTTPNAVIWPFVAVKTSYLASRHSSTELAVWVDHLIWPCSNYQTGKMEGKVKRVGCYIIDHCHVDITLKDIGALSQISKIDIMSFCGALTCRLQRCCFVPLWDTKLRTRSALRCNEQTTA